MRQQKAFVISIQGSPPTLALGCVAYFKPQAPWLKLAVIDPAPGEPEPLSIQVDIDRYLLAYYEPFMSAIDAGGTPVRKRVSDQEYGAPPTYADLDQFSLRIGLLTGIDRAIRRAKERGNLTGPSQTISGVLSNSSVDSIYSDGTLVDARWQDSVSIDDWQ